MQDKGRRVIDKESSKQQQKSVAFNDNKENINQKTSYKELLSPSSSKKKKEIEQLGELEIKQLTNTRSKNKKQQSDFIEIKNQMSPLQYNREQERFSYLLDPIVGDQCQANNYYQSYPNQQHTQAYPYQDNPNNQHQYYPYSNYYPHQSQPLQQPLPHQYNYQQQWNQSYPQQQQQQQQQQQIYQQRQNLSTLNNLACKYMNTSIGKSQQTSQSSDLSCKEDSFGNVQITNRRNQMNYNDNIQHKIHNIPTLPPPPSYLNLQQKEQLEKSELNKYMRPQIANRLQERERKLLPRVNLTTIVFFVLVGYVLFKNQVKIKGYVEFIGQQFQKIDAPKQQPKEVIQEKERNNILNSSHVPSNENQYEYELSNEAILAKKFSKELMQELLDILKQKRRIYRQEYEESLQKRFMMPMLREILPEVITQFYLQITN